MATRGIVNHPIVVPITIIIDYWKMLRVWANICFLLETELRAIGCRLLEDFLQDAVGDGFGDDALDADLLGLCLNVFILIVGRTEVERFDSFSF